MSAAQIVKQTRARKADVAKFPDVDGLDAANRAKTDHTLESALTMARPVNGWGTGASQELLRVERDEGLPLARVPRAETIKEMNGAADADARLNVLESYRDQILEDCENELAYCDDDEIVGKAELAQRAIDAIRAGHHQTGIALAVSLGEPRAVCASTPRVNGFESEQDREDWEAKRKSKKKGGKYRYA